MAEDAWLSDPTLYTQARRPGAGDPWGVHASARGHQGTQTILAAGEIEPSDDLRRLLDLESGETAVIRRRLIVLDETPIEVATSYYPGAIARGTGLDASRKIPGGALTLLASLGLADFGEPEEWVNAALATGEISRALNIADGSPVLVLSRLLRTSTGQPVELSEMVMTRKLPYGNRKQAD